jgi:surface-anchored protein
MRTTFPSLLAAAVVVLCQTPARAQVVLTAGHADIGLGFGNGQWNLHVHDEDNGVEYAPSGAPGATNWALLQVGQSARTSRPPGTQWNFLGAPAGGNVWILPQTQNPSLLFLGVAAEIEPPDAFSSQITLTLKALFGPAGANFSVWTTDQFGNPTARMASFDGITAADSLAVPIGGHAHFNFGFTQPGNYQIAFEASGTPTGTNPPRSGDVIYSFQVVPEPSSFALLALAAVGGLTAKRWRRRGAGASGGARAAAPAASPLPAEAIPEA